MLEILLEARCICTDECDRSLKVLEWDPRTAVYADSREELVTDLSNVYVDLGEGHPPVVDVMRDDGTSRMLVLSYVDAEALVALGAVLIAKDHWRLT